MGTRSNPLAEAVLTSNHKLCVEKKYKKYQNFLLTKLHALFSVMVREGQMNLKRSSAAISIYQVKQIKLTQQGSQTRKPATLHYENTPIQIH